MSQNKLLSLLFFLILFLQVEAKPIDTPTAIETAKAFLKTLSGRSMLSESATSSELKLTYICTEKQLTQSQASVFYYVFNRGENEGFIIVSADDRAKAILGYSDKGAFDYDNIPDNFRYWLDCYTDELKNLTGKQESRNTQNGKRTVTPAGGNYKTSVTPLLGEIRYGQDDPYNSLCPLIPGSQTRTVTGCVATSMAQVMRYHQWPKRGKESHAYTTRQLKIPMSADFANTVYDWNNMHENYTSSTTGETQKNAVATLMLHCGISVDMDYNVESGATINKIGRALIRYFDYQATLQMHNRPYFTTGQWSDMLKEELSNNRPLIYNGVSSTAGHSFVCDGYDEGGLFHINWGWDGMSNGYFELSVLNPSEQGTGGGLGGYNMEQSVIVGIKPSEGTQNKSQYQIRLVKGLSYPSQEVSTGEKAVIDFGYRNLGVGSFYGYHGMGLYQTDGTFVYTLSRGILGHKENNEIIPDTLDTGSGNANLQSRFTVSNDLPQGTFRIYPVYQFGSTPDDSQWEIIPGELGMPSFLNTEIGDSGIRFSDPGENLPEFTLTGLKTIGNLYNSRTGRFEFTVRNTGTEYTGSMYIYFTKKDDDQFNRLIGPEGVFIPAGETKHYEFNGLIDLDPGTYLATVMYDYKNGYLFDIGESLPVNILETPAEEPDMTIERLETDLDLSHIDKNKEIVLTATLKNNGGYASAQAMAIIYFPDGRVAESFGNQTVYLDKGEIKEFTFKGFTGQEPGQYYTRIYLKVEDNEWESAKPLSNNKLTFTLVDGGSGVSGESFQQTEIYPNPVTDYLFITGEPSNATIRIFDLSGSPLRQLPSATSGQTVIDVNNLPTGTYLLQIQTDSRMIHRKFIKR